MGHNKCIVGCPMWGMFSRFSFFVSRFSQNKEDEKLLRLGPSVPCYIRDGRYIGEDFCPHGMLCIPTFSSTFPNTLGTFSRTKPG